MTGTRRQLDCATCMSPGTRHKALAGYYVAALIPLRCRALALLWLLLSFPRQMNCHGVYAFPPLWTGPSTSPWSASAVPFWRRLSHLVHLRGTQTHDRLFRLGTDSIVYLQNDKSEHHQILLWRNYSFMLNNDQCATLGLGSCDLYVSWHVSPTTSWARNVYASCATCTHHACVGHGPPSLLHSSHQVHLPQGQKQPPHNHDSRESCDRWHGVCKQSTQGSWRTDIMNIQYTKRRHNTTQHNTVQHQYQDFVNKNCCWVFTLVLDTVSNVPLPVYALYCDNHCNISPQSCASHVEAASCEFTAPMIFGTLRKIQQSTHFPETSLGFRFWLNNFITPAQHSPLPPVHTRMCGVLLW